MTRRLLARIAQGAADHHRRCQDRVRACFSTQHEVLASELFDWPRSKVIGRQGGPTASPIADPHFRPFTTDPDASLVSYPSRTAMAPPLQ